MKHLHIAVTACAVVLVAAAPAVPSLEVRTDESLCRRGNIFTKCTDPELEPDTHPSNRAPTRSNGQPSTPILLKEFLKEDDTQAEELNFAERPVNPVLRESQESLEPPVQPLTRTPTSHSDNSFQAQEQGQPLPSEAKTGARSLSIPGPPSLQEGDHGSPKSKTSGQARKSASITITQDLKKAKLAQAREERKKMEKGIYNMFA